MEEVRTYPSGDAATVPFGRLDGTRWDELDLVWDAGRTGSLLVEGRMGTGISALLRTLVRHALSDPEGWEAVVICMTTRYGDDVRVALRTDARDASRAAGVTEDLLDLAHTRLDALEDLGVREVAALDAFGPERPRRILVAVEQLHHYPERVIARVGRLVRIGGAAGIHVAALGGHTALLPAAMRKGFGARAEIPEMLSGRVSYAEFGVDPVWGCVRDTSARELDEIAARCCSDGGA